MEDIYLKINNKIKSIMNNKFKHAIKFKIVIQSKIRKKNKVKKIILKINNKNFMIF